MHKFSLQSIILFTTVSMTFIFGMVLSSANTSADESVVDDVTINVPVACTFSGTGMTSHNATIMPGNIARNIGNTTMKVFCNDSDGFAIYAIGYTDDTDGKTVLTSSALGPTYDIATGTGTSGNSQWAMRLTTPTSPTPTYPIAIQNNYDSSSYHIVPNDYDLVAKRLSATDVGDNAEGSTMNSTYQAYVSPTQVASTYIGKVKYVMVHPNDAYKPLKNEVEVIFNGNGLVFPGGGTTNRLLFRKTCIPNFGYVSNSYQEVMTSNITAGGTQNGPYTDNESILQPITLPNADRIKVIVDYGITADTIYATIAEGSWAGWDDDGPSGRYEDIYNSSENITGQQIFIFDGDTITIDSRSWGIPESGYDKGFYFRIYPVYNTEQPNTTYEEFPGDEECSIEKVSGTYAETTTWNGRWYNDTGATFDSENSINDYIDYYFDDLEGSTVELYSSNYYTIKYDANGGSGTMADQIMYQYSYEHLYENAFSKPGVFLVGWNTKADGTGESYGNGASIGTPIDGVSSGGTVTLFAQWGECSTERVVCYDGNGSDVEGSMGLQSVSRNDTKVMLLASNYSREGYGFAGWNTKADGTGTFYGPNEEITDAEVMNSLKKKGKRLYAIWVPSSDDLQDWGGCSILTPADEATNILTQSVVALTDQRDNQTYAVARLADGNCWMIENLRLESQGSTGANASLAQGYDSSSTYGDFIGLATAESSDFENSTTSNGLYSTSTIKGGNSLYRGYRFPRYNNTNTQSRASDPTTYNNNFYSHGNYYTWSAAIASIQQYSTINQSVTNSSICPLGWQLPKGGNKDNEQNNDFWNLIVNGVYDGVKPTNYNTSTPYYRYSNELGLLEKFPNNFIYSGNITGSSISSWGSTGYYQTATSSIGVESNYSNNFILYFNRAGVYPGNYPQGRRGSGYSIRCMLPVSS